ncbi:MAG: hypothetical protein IJJ64_11360 [Butyrivibrio sp.]|nr:hypothetical protein [Butyrivibrio sp.]
MAKEVKKSNSKTNKTATTVTVTVETKKEYAPSYKMPIDKGDRGTEKYYKQHEGVKVATVHGTGRMQTFAYIPDEDYENASDEEKAAIKQRTDSFSRQADNMRRTESRKNSKVKEHEVVSLESLMDAGYDPSIDSIDVAVKITNDLNEKDESLEYATEDENMPTDIEENTFDDSDSYDNYDDCVNKSKVSRGGYFPNDDFNNPENILEKKQLLEKLHEIIDGLEGIEKDIAEMIMDGTPEREKAKELNIPQSTLNGRKIKLLARFKTQLEMYI